MTTPTRSGATRSACRRSGSASSPTTGGDRSAQLGPNGPDSEIYFDLGPEYRRHGERVPGDGSRYLEVWNNVFMEFFQAPDGSRTPLPRQHVDTGMGLERLTMIMQGAESIYDTDLYQTIIQTRRGAGRRHLRGRRRDSIARCGSSPTIRAAATFLIADGVLPGNEGRSYVLRRILRRAIRARPQARARRTVPGRDGGGRHRSVRGQLPGAARAAQSQIERVLTHEEETFGRTLTTGMIAIPGAGRRSGARCGRAARRVATCRARR